MSAPVTAPAGWRWAPEVLELAAEHQAQDDRDGDVDDDKDDNADPPLLPADAAFGGGVKTHEIVHLLPPGIDAALNCRGPKLSGVGGIPPLSP